MRVCVCVCVREFKEDRECDSAEHGGYERRSQEEKYEGSLVNSCADFACLYVHGLACMQS